jgi:CHAD domain-containing protein
MKYSLDLDKPIGDEVRRIAMGRLTEAGRLLCEQPDGLDEAIHQARRHIKQCRALYRLVASESEGFQKTENERLRDIGQRLSHMRDAKAQVEVAQYLKQEIPSKANGMLMDRLIKRLEQRRKAMTTGAAGSADALAKAEHDLAEAAEAVDQLMLPHSTRKCAACMAQGWERAGRKARDSISASAEGKDEAFHDLRKRTQDRWMHAALLRDLWPTAMVSIQREAKGLSDLLGHAQDLVVLLETVSGSGEPVGDSVEGEAVRDVILSQQKKLRDESRELGAALFCKSRPRDDAMIERLLLDR